MVFCGRKGEGCLGDGVGRREGSWGAMVQGSTKGESKKKQSQKNGKKKETKKEKKKKKVWEVKSGKEWKISENTRNI